MKVIVAIRLFLISCTLFFDLKTLWLVRRYNSGSNQVHVNQIQGNQVQGNRRHILNEIPARASILNVLSIVYIYFVYNLISSPNSQQLILLSLISLLVFNLVKSPFNVFLTIRVNASNARIDQDEERERKRQLEIQEAKQRRDERIARQLAMQEEGNHYVYLNLWTNY